MAASMCKKDGVGIRCWLLTFQITPFATHVSLQGYFKQVNIIIYKAIQENLKALPFGLGRLILIFYHSFIHV